LAPRLVPRLALFQQIVDQAAPVGLRVGVLYRVKRCEGAYDRQQEGEFCHTSHVGALPAPAKPEGEAGKGTHMRSDT
jgi:hypothetical protein